MKSLVAVLLVAAGAGIAVVFLPDVLDVLVVVAAALLGGLVFRAGVEVTRAEPPPPAPAVDIVEELRALLALVPEGILVVDAEERVLVANPAAARILNRPEGAMEGVTLIRATRDAALAQVLREAAGEPRDVPLSDDRLVRVAARWLPGPRALAVLTVQDVTALRNAERARSELVANVSHELRTPIAAARALAETLEAGVDEPEQRERFHARLTRELERLGEIVERLLRLSRLESRAEEFDIQPVDVMELVHMALARVLPVADRARVTLAVEEDVPGGGGRVLADRERALEVLTNLLDNALRYSPAEGTITVAVGPVGHAVRVCVRDQGPGILPADRQRIFERFYTADRARTGGAGTGLGLAIARHIVTRLHGEIWVADATPGATLCFTLPRVDAPV